MKANISSRLIVTLLTILVLIFAASQWVFAHGTDVHGYSFNEHSSENANNLTKKAIETTGITFQANDTMRIKQGSVDEDKSFADPFNFDLFRYRGHHYNPHTQTGGPFFGKPAVDVGENRWATMQTAFTNASSRWSGDESAGVQGSMHALGRVLHLLQDMSAPPHVHAPDGHGWPFPRTGPANGVGYYSDFETLWSPSSTVHDDPYYAPQWTFPSESGGPLTPEAAIEADIPNSKLDSDSFSLMRGRINSIPYDKRNTIEGYMKAQAWITYFHTSFYGQINYNESEPAPWLTSSNNDNVFRNMFTKPSGELRISYNSGLNFWTIDGVGYYNRSNQYFPEDWWPCPGEYPLGKRDQGWGSSRHIKGRFYIYLHYYEGSTSQYWNKATPPNNWPNGESNSGMSLAQYYGEVLLPLSVRFCAGLMRELFPAPALSYPTYDSSAGSTVPVTVTWPAVTTNAGSATTYKLQRSNNGGAWNDVTGWITDRSFTENLPSGTYRYRAKSRGWFTSNQIESAWGESGHDCVLSASPPTSYVVTAATGGHGSVDPIGHVYLAEGENQTFTAAPDGGYVIDKWYLDGGVVQTGGNSYTVMNVRACHSLFVTFKSLGYNQIIVLSPNTGGYYYRGTSLPIIDLCINNAMVRVKRGAVLTGEHTNGVWAGIGVTGGGFC